MDTPENLPTTPNGATGAWDRRLDKARSAAHTKIDRLSESARPAVDRLSTSAHKTVDKLSANASHAAVTLSEKADQLRNAQQHLLSETRARIQERPVTSMAIAVAAGFLLRQLFRSRSR